MPQTRRKIHVFPGKSELTRAAADYVLHHTSEAIKIRGQATVVLAGGSTPKKLYSLLATPAYRERLDWSQVQVFWGDERHVPPDHPDSNYGMANQTMLSKLPIPVAHIHRMEGERPDAQDAANAYETLIQTHFQIRQPEIPQLDVVLLGLGPDGHTASLFPGTAAVHERERWVAAPWVEKFHTHRITMTPALLNQASQIGFLVSGQDKSAALCSVLDSRYYRPDEFPTQIIQPAHGTVTWFLDAAAAQDLPKPS